MNLDQVSLDDKCERADGELYLTGTRTLVWSPCYRDFVIGKPKCSTAGTTRCLGLQSSDQTDCNAGSNSLEIIRRLCNAVDSGMPAQWVRISRWLTPNSSQYGRSCS